MTRYQDSVRWPSIQRDSEILRKYIATAQMAETFYTVTEQQPARSSLLSPRLPRVGVEAETCGLEWRDSLGHFKEVA